ncbi:MAG: hypothetical protein RPR40_04535, partial [Bermanella sp.]
SFIFYYFPMLENLPRLCAAFANLESFIVLLILLYSRPFHKSHIDNTGQIAPRMALYAYENIFSRERSLKAPLEPASTE